MAKTVVGLMENMGQAQKVVQELETIGFSRESINLIGSHQVEGAHRPQDVQRSETAEGAATGAGAGATVGGLAGFVAGLTAITIPGIGPAVALGPLGAALAGVGIGAVAGGAIGAIMKMGVPEKDARYYFEGVKRGGVLVAVTAPDDMVERAASVMQRHGAVDIDKRAEQWEKEGWTEARPQAATTPTIGERTPDERARHAARHELPVRERERRSEPYSGARERRTGERTYPGDERRLHGERVLPVAEEEVRVGKREVPQGKVRVYSEAKEVPAQEEAALREERAKVERRPVDRPATGAEGAFKEESVDIREMKEEPVVAKETRVKEEVVVGKESYEHPEIIRETARRTQVDVEQGAQEEQAAERVRAERLRAERAQAAPVEAQRTQVERARAEKAQAERVQAERGQAERGQAEERREVGPEGLSPEDEEFRSHYQTALGGKDDDFEAYRSAYHYADEDAEARRYRGRDFSEIEDDLHRSWDRSHPGTWSKFKEAIRYGWNRKRHI